MSTLWKLNANCRGEPINLFFPQRTDHHSVNRKALKLCENCPVKEPCLETAIADPKLSGIWGGATGMKRKQIRKQRKKEENE